MIISDKFLKKMIDSFNSMLFVRRKRLNLTVSGQELPSPKPRSLHRFTYNKIYALAKGLSKTMTISSPTDTNSMEPVMDAGHLALIDDKTKVSDLIVGDIVLFYRKLDRSPRVLHRIIEIGTDSEGWFCYTRGDNTVWLDGKVRYEDIYGLCYGVLY